MNLNPFARHRAKLLEQFEIWSERTTYYGTAMADGLILCQEPASPEVLEARQQSYATARACFFEARAKRNELATRLGLR